MVKPTRKRLSAVLLSCALACGGVAAAGSSAAAPGPAPDGLDHFKCYRAAADTKDRFERLTNVVLTDQFGQEQVKVAKFPNRLCNPVEKTLRPGRPTRPAIRRPIWSAGPSPPRHRRPCSRTR